MITDIGVDAQIVVCGTESTAAVAPGILETETSLHGVVPRNLALVVEIGRKVEHAKSRIAPCTAPIVGRVALGEVERATSGGLPEVGAAGLHLHAVDDCGGKVHLYQFFREFSAVLDGLFRDVVAQGSHV